jgi:bifunctional non-homologous end joining protein LigD
MKDIFGLLPEAREALRKESFPRWLSPMLATLTDTPFSNPDWIYERKLDGVRILTFRLRGEVRLVTRNRKNRNAAYPEIVDALSSFDDRHDVVLDGEVVAFDGDLTSFKKLQPRINLQDPDKARATGIEVFYYVFDILHLDGYSVRAVPLRYRKRLLRNVFSYRNPIRYTTHRNERGEEFLKEACKRGWEGLIAKRASSPYVHQRSRDWLKVKCVNQQEFVIGGFTDPQGSRVGLGALLVGYYEDGALRYAGKVGTGFDHETLERLRSKLDRLERKTPPFDDEDLPRKSVHWVSPRLVCEVGFTEWTADGKLRHPRFLGLREDKPAREVVRERPA